jgi:hypothetical protein
VIRALRDWYGGDAGAAKPRQGRRFTTVGFAYECFWDEENIDVDEAVRLYGGQPDALELPELTQVDLTSEEIVFYQDVWTRKLKSAQDNKSSADFGLAIYLLERGKSADVVVAAIRCARPTVAEDKAHVEKYLRYTVTKAITKLSQS